MVDIVLNVLHVKYKCTIAAYIKMKIQNDLL